MEFIRKNKSRYFAALCTIFFLSVLSFLMYANISYNADMAATGDAVRYIEMSKHTFANVDPPFALRILSPLIIKVIAPLINNGINFPWMILTLLASVVSLLVFFHILFKSLRLSFFNSIVFTIALAHTYSYTFFNYSDFWLVDPLNNLFFMFGILFLIEKRYRAFLLTVVIGFMNKEIVLFLLPLYPLRVFLSTEDIKSKQFVRSVGYSILVVLLFLLFRRTIANIIGSGVPYSIINNSKNQSFLENIVFNISNIKNEINIYTVFDFFWILFAYSLYLVYQKFGIKNWYFLSSVYIFFVLFISRFFATDVERVFVTMAPFVFILTAIMFADRNSVEDKKWLIVIIFTYSASNLGWIPSNYFIASNILVLILFGTIFANIESSFANSKRFL